MTAGATPEGEAPSWHALAPEAVAARLEVDPDTGLSPARARERLARQGPNRLAEPARRSPWRVLLAQFKSLLILVLIAAALLASAIGDLKDAAVILIVVVLNALLGFRQEYRAERAMAALRGMLAPQAEVRRDGHSRMLPAEELVPGDLVLLDAGDRIPADGRLIRAHGLEVDESTLTGESIPTGKDTAACAAESPLAERANMGYMNTVVTRGRGELLVTATGMDTEMGRLARMLSDEAQPDTPLQRQLDTLGRRLAGIAGLVVILILIAGLLRGEALVEIILTSIALAVAAIPEGLPAVVTITLALGMHRMARRHAIVKRLAAVETLGCTSVICTDKTGTLTLNQMTARRLWTRGTRLTVSGEGYTCEGTIESAENNELPELQPVLECAALCNDSRLRAGEVIGDPTEAALLVLATKGGLEPEAARERLPRIAEIPFDSTRKYMATFHHDGDRVRLYAKGAPDVLLARCRSVFGTHGERALDAAGREAVEQEYNALAEQGLRVLALAQADLPARDFDPEGDLPARAEALTLLGLVGLQDPPRPEARAAIARCRDAGIQVKMITGDHAITARAIARELGLAGEVLTGAELDRLDQAQLAARLKRTGVFARVAPAHKVRLVDALKAQGEVVAMTGDGVNDAPALKRADMGVAMGITGTDVTREAAAMVLTDDNFATIVQAVEEGRTLYDNIVKFVRFQLSTNIGAILTVALAPLLGLPLPFTAVQLLWVNLIMDGPPALALGLDPPRPGIMAQPPRAPDAHILSLPRLARLIFYGGIMTIGTLGMLYYGLHKLPEAQALTLAFTTFVLFQCFNAFNARAGEASALRGYLFTNPKLWLALAGVVGLQVLAVHWPPAQQIFHTTALGAREWLLATGVAASILVLNEMRKGLGRLLGRLRS
ncbi:MAG: calcium-translocating P-type ATPase, PMCA-type [Gammaproteobacteria bacterium]|nr:calcium-translocating P-type ATPase, PMCA-type [Gammaproteobacteria bacterium]